MLSVTLFYKNTGNKLALGGVVAFVACGETGIFAVLLCDNTAFHIKFFIFKSLMNFRHNGFPNGCRRTGVIYFFLLIEAVPDRADIIRRSGNHPKIV